MKCGNVLKMLGESSEGEREVGRGQKIHGHLTGNSTIGSLFAILAARVMDF